MKKELIYRIVRIVLAMTFGLILFPYLEKSLIKYTDQIVFFSLFSSIVTGVISLLTYNLIKMIKKKEDYNNLHENIHYIFRLILFVFFTTYGLTIFEKHWILLVLIGIEIYGILNNNEFERVK